jgi:hypothetical protein
MDEPDRFGPTELVYDDLQAMLRPSTFTPTLLARGQDAPACEVTGTATMNDDDGGLGPTELVNNGSQAMVRPSTLSPMRSPKDRNVAVCRLDLNANGEPVAASGRVAFQVTGSQSRLWGLQPPTITNNMPSAAMEAYEPMYDRATEELVAAD